MGFCRRCGDIVTGERCHCGGIPVAASWKNASASSTNTQDRWSKTYVSSRATDPTSVDQSEPRKIPNARSNSSGIATTATSTSSNAINSRRFPRPLSSASSVTRSFKNGVNDHIALATSPTPRPPSPLKKSTTMSDVENDILPSFHPHEPTLSKVYGSVLQPKETLTMYSCAQCSTAFPPDATIYPDPDPSKSNSFLCKPCFTVSGGSKGQCPACSRPVLTLKSEGGFVHSDGQYWHKRCYNCASCLKNIGDAPMVDLFGRPSCVDCFDSCFKRDPTTPKKERHSNNNSPSYSNPGGLNATRGRKSRESSPTLDELEQRLGIVKSGESSPAVLDTGRIRSNSLSSTNRKISYARSPKSKNDNSVDYQPPIHPYSIAGSLSSGNLHYSSSTSPGRISISSSTDVDGSPTGIARRRPTSSNVMHGVESPKETSPTPSGYSSLTIKRIVPSENDTHGSIRERGTSLVVVSNVSTCNQCLGPVLNPREGGQYVTIPGADENTVPQIYHTECFKCVVCDKSFGDVKKGQASFVKTDSGPCHTQCAPAQHFVVRKPISAKSLRNSSSTSPPNAPLSQIQDPVAAQFPVAKPSFFRFGGQNTCPGCQKPVSLMERGVVPGPQGTRWHASCLVCGGKKEVTRAYLLGRSREDKKDVPGCGKKLDSAAKTDGEGGVWCRECLLLLGCGGSPLTSPIKSPPVTTPAASPTKIINHHTGTTTIARQFTGFGGGSEAILRQLTGGGLTPTRSISPTKQLGLPGGAVRPRPKSVIGMRSTKSIDEGRGMFLVRQFTGSTTNGLAGL